MKLLKAAVASVPRYFGRILACVFLMRMPTTDWDMSVDDCMLLLSDDLSDDFDDSEGGVWWYYLRLNGPRDGYRQPLTSLFAQFR